ncbi:MAG: hypothetical protein J0H34_23800 [Rhizobiales bacterium]|nr:hypothetical protein [Hyphomicrobiales bacterium]
MSNFWESSPLWQRAQELGAELDRAKKAQEEAGARVLYYIEINADSPHGSMWHERRQAYKDAAERRDEASRAWRSAREAFGASSAGRAYRRWLGLIESDPIARASSPAVEEVA